MYDLIIRFMLTQMTIVVRMILMLYLILNKPSYILYKNEYINKFKDLYALKTINATDIDIPVTTVDFECIQPFNTTICAVTDIGANIQAINHTINIILFIKRHINVQLYLPMHIKYIAINLYIPNFTQFTTYHTCYHIILHLLRLNPCITLFTLAYS